MIAHQKRSWQWSDLTQQRNRLWSWVLSSIPISYTDVSLRPHVETGYDTSRCFRGIKATKSDDDHSLPTSTKEKNVWGSTSALNTPSLRGTRLFVTVNIKMGPVTVRKLYVLYWRFHIVELPRTVRFYMLTVLYLHPEFGATTVHEAPKITSNFGTSTGEM
jgi:hypothetical protein